MLKFGSGIWRYLVIWDFQENKLENFMKKKKVTYGSIAEKIDKENWSLV